MYVHCTGCKVQGYCICVRIYNCMYTVQDVNYVDNAYVYDYVRICKCMYIVQDVKYVDTACVYDYVRISKCMYTVQDVKYGDTACVYDYVRIPGGSEDGSTHTSRER